MCGVGGVFNPCFGSGKRHNAFDGSGYAFDEGRYAVDEVGYAVDEN